MEILLLLGESPAILWPAEKVYEQIQSSRSSVSGQLALLCRQGLVESASESGGPLCYRFKPATEELARAVAELRLAYRERRVKVVETIYSGMDPLRSFADAFKFRRDN